MDAGDFDDFPEDSDRESLQEVADRFFTDWPDTEPFEEPSQEPPSEPVRRPVGRMAGIATVLALFIAVPVVLDQQPAVSDQTVAQVSVELRLDPPVDNGGTADLNWHGAGGLHYAVVVAGASMPTKVIFVNGERTSLRVALDPARQYCFQVQATDGTQVYQSPPRAIRDAVCRM